MCRSYSIKGTENKTQTFKKKAQYFEKLQSYGHLRLVEFRGLYLTYGRCYDFENSTLMPRDTFAKGCNQNWLNRDKIPNLESNTDLSSVSHVKVILIKSN